MKSSGVLVGLLWALSAEAANTHQNPELKQFLKEFHANPVEVMGQLPHKAGAVDSFFKPEEVKSKSFVHAKAKFRDSLVPDKAAIEKEDLASDVVDRGTSILTSLSDIDDRNMAVGGAQMKPWSGDHWPFYSGLLGKRYADPARPGGEDWKKAKDYVTSRPVDAYISEGRVDLLSPAEKYDLLIGDKSFNLTAKSWAAGQEYFDVEGRVVPWVGICHGWAPASMMLARPTKKITVLAADGVTKIPFYPTDIKALATLLWANVRINVQFAGSRCDDPAPLRDPANGRVTDKKCFDTNPGTFHEIILNQVGIVGRPVLLDASFDHEVWNHPVTYYQYSYFNPQTGNKAQAWRQAAVRPSEYSKDKFKSYRSPDASYVVGVEMKIKYTAGALASARETDGPSMDGQTTATYRYDLEVNEDGKIIGGEWYSNAHPDFMWVPPVGSRIRTASDHYATGDWEVEQQDGAFPAIPGHWQTPALNASAEQKVPLATIVEGLIERSNL